MSKPRRLDQMLASLGYGSRREAMGLVDRGNVTVRGVVVTEPEHKAISSDVLVRGEPLEAPEGLLALLHKPLGYVCTHASDEGPTIYELLPPRWLKRNPAVTSVGRLDKDTSGLLLITDQGLLVQRWTSPKALVEKIYEVEVDASLDVKLVEIFASGTVQLRGEDKPCLPACLKILGDKLATVTLTEGRYHQVRRMFASQGWHVVKLHRSRFGAYELADLKVGEHQLLPFPALP